MLEAVPCRLHRHERLSKIVKFCFCAFAALPIDSAYGFWVDDGDVRGPNSIEVTELLMQLQEFDVRIYLP